MALLSSTARPDEIDPADYDAIYFTGGHAVMWDFPADEGLQRIARAIWERGGIVSSVCHGYCGLLDTRRSDGTLLVAGRRITGFSWTEERLVGVAGKMPYNAEAEMKRRGALYENTLLPFVSLIIPRFVGHGFRPFVVRPVLGFYIRERSGFASGYTSPRYRRRGLVKHPRALPLPIAAGGRVRPSVCGRSFHGRIIVAASRAAH